MASRRIKILTKLRDELAAVFPVGGCELWQQRGIRSADQPQATITIDGDRNVGDNVRVHDGTAGRSQCELSLVVDVSVFEDVEEEPVEKSTIELVDEQLVIAHKAIKRINWAGVLDVLDAAPELDLRITDTLFFPVINEMPFPGGTLRLLVRYSHYEQDPEAA